MGSNSEIQDPSSLSAMDPDSESQEFSSDYLNFLNFEPQDLSSVSAMTPKDRINYELLFLSQCIACKAATASGYNDDFMWTPEQLATQDRNLRERIAFIGAHPLFSEIRSEGRPDDCLQNIWGSLEKMSEGWVGTIREVDRVNCMVIQMVMGFAKVV